jgi:hypothetical protein
MPSPALAATDGASRWQPSALAGEPRQTTCVPTRGSPDAQRRAEACCGEVRIG